MNILFTICGRAGSKGFENKNLKEMNGIPLVYYTLAVVREYADHYLQDKVNVALNTDSALLADMVKKQTMIGNILTVSRKPELAGDFTAKVDVIRDTYLEIGRELNLDMVIDLDITSPLRTVTDIRNAVDVYNKGKEYDLVYSVVESRRSPYFNMVQESSDGYFHKICDGNITARQQSPKCYELNASIYVYRPSFLERPVSKAITQYKTGIVLMKDWRVLDIDSEEDFLLMEFLHQYYCKNDEGIRTIYERAKAERWPEDGHLSDEITN